MVNDRERRRVYRDTQRPRCCARTQTAVFGSVFPACVGRARRSVLANSEPNLRPHCRIVSCVTEMPRAASISSTAHGTFGWRRRRCRGGPCSPNSSGRPGQLRIDGLVAPGAEVRSKSPAGPKFADSPLEGDGFEPSVPGESGFGFAREGPNIRIQLQRRVIQTR
jgi:hypothetical protein